MLALTFSRTNVVRWSVRVNPPPPKDAPKGVSCTFLGLGIQGLAPYWFEVEPTVYLSQDGDLSAELVAAYELLFTQRLILEPEVEVGLALQEVPEWGVGSGLNDVTAGLRLRYEISRQFAPYVGLSWMNRFGEAAELAEAEGEESSDLFFVVGTRMWR